ncbi:MAG: hypothetical protein J5449_10470, partial [Oscillospiraceae bacterium]|nr:hypothetical protein [Oscillospiraceae bacterium]
MKAKAKRILTLLLVLTMALSLVEPALAADDASGSTLRLSTAEGSVTVKDASGKEKTVRDDMRLYNGYTVETGKSSSAYITIDDSKAVKLDSLGK